MAEKTSGLPPTLTRNDTRTFAGIFVASFIVFLMIAIIAQTFTWHWRLWLPGAEGEKSLIGGVKAAVYTFMSHLT
jgi:light-harvesting complex 1 beta chain